MNKKKGRLSRSRLAVQLSAIKGFNDPKVRVEQYITDGEIGATVLWDAYMKGDIMGKVIADLGAGTGILGIGCMILGAAKVYFVESESPAMNICKDNVGERINMENNQESESLSTFFLGDVSLFNEKVDTVVMNPPFGVKSEHSDRRFLEKAFLISDVVYSFHKSETKEFIERFAKANRFMISQVIDFEFPLKASMSFHRKKIEKIKVSSFRFVKK